MRIPKSSLQPLSNLNNLIGLNLNVNVVNQSGCMIDVPSSKLLRDTSQRHAGYASSPSVMEAVMIKSDCFKHGAEIT